MSHKLELRPDADVDVVKEQAPDIHFESLEEDLKGAADAAGEEAVAVAVGQVMRHEAEPTALLAWIDDLRNPEAKEQAAEADDPFATGFLQDFVADTEFDGGAMLPKPDSESGSDAPGGADDADFFFSVARRRQFGDDDDDDAPPEVTPEPEEPAADTKTTKSS